ncbi:MAG: 5-formyltetrahydrofolate cyclo-ligase [Gammaproteobacteria bacterium]
MNKSELRTHMRLQRRRLSFLVQERHGRDFLDRIIRLRAYQRCQKLACYMPVSGELDTYPLMEHALSEGRELYLPVIDTNRMWFTRWFGETLPIDRTSRIPQPLKKQRRLVNTNALDLVIVPLVSFGRDGSRLGQGGGYYDRAFWHRRFQSWRRPLLVGAAHDVQEFTHIPNDPWDIPLDGIVTNRETIL